VCFVFVKKLFVPLLNFSHVDGPWAGGLRFAVLLVLLVVVFLDVCRLLDVAGSRRLMLGNCGFGSFHFGIDSLGSFGIESLGKEKPDSRSSRSTASVMRALTPPLGAWSLNGSTTRYSSSVWACDTAGEARLTTIIEAKANLMGLLRGRAV
jgi:hypothetical protein